MEGGYDGGMEDVDTCMLCNRSEQLLVCCESGCAAALHRKCMSVEPKFDDVGNFYCPRCWCTLHNAKKDELFEEVMLAKKALLEFISVGTEESLNDLTRQEHETNMGECREHDQYVDADGVSKEGGIEMDENNNHAHANDETKAEVLEDDKWQGVDEYINEECVHLNELVDAALADAALADAGISEEEEMQVCDVDEALEEEDKGRLDVEENIHQDSPEASNTNRKREIASKRQMKEKTAPLREGYSLRDKLASPHETVSKKEDTVKNKLQIRSRSPKVGSEKRQRLHWTPEEEDMLREGVQKYSMKANKNIPWRKILEFGRHVFHQTRFPTDLKDKWKNMIAKEPSIRFS